MSPVKLHVIFVPLNTVQLVRLDGEVTLKGGGVSNLGTGWHSPTYPPAFAPAFSPDPVPVSVPVPVPVPVSAPAPAPAQGYRLVENCYLI